MNQMMKRLEAIERMICADGDPELLAFGETVTDEELQQVATEEDQHGGGGRALFLSDSELWRICRPRIEQLRTEGAKP